eukprot:37081-Rhodomonas_salina.1
MSIVAVRVLILTTINRLSLSLLPPPPSSLSSLLLLPPPSSLRPLSLFPPLSLLSPSSLLRLLLAEDGADAQA